MLFILGLTFFVSVIAQTRLLEGITFFLLAAKPRRHPADRHLGHGGRRVRLRHSGRRLDDRADDPHAGDHHDARRGAVASIRYAVMVCTAVTTICGIWLAYGEPPNLIMKANLHPFWTTPSSFATARRRRSPAIWSIAWQLRKTARRPAHRLANLDVIDANAADVRFLQAGRHGEVMTPRRARGGRTRPNWGAKRHDVLSGCASGESLGLAMVAASVPEATRKKLLGHFVSEELADALDAALRARRRGDHTKAPCMPRKRSTRALRCCLALRQAGPDDRGAWRWLPFVGHAHRRTA